MWGDDVMVLNHCHVFNSVNVSLLIALEMHTVEAKMQRLMVNSSGL